MLRFIEAYYHTCLVWWTLISTYRVFLWGVSTSRGQVLLLRRMELNTFLTLSLSVISLLSSAGTGFVFFLNCLINLNLKWSPSFFLQCSAAGWWSCFDWGALWQAAAQGVIVPPRGLRETAVEAWTTVNHVVHHTDQEEEEEEEGVERRGKKERKQKLSSVNLRPLLFTFYFCKLLLSFITSSFPPKHLPWCLHTVYFTLHKQG